MTTDSEPEADIDLAREPDFRLGGATVRPSTGRIVQGEQELRVQPRVMQVLVVFARRAGETVTRDQLIEACWGGRIVSDDAIKFAVGQVRQLARAFEPAPFSIETVPRVGFRLVPAEGGATAAADDLRQPARRRPLPLWLLGLGGVAVAALAGWLIWRTLPTKPDPGENGQVEVMTFQSEGADPRLKAVADGIGETIVRSLAGIGVGMTSTEAHPPDAGGGAAEFRVAGSVGRQGESLVVTPQVIERRSGVILWTNRFTGKASDADNLAIQAAEEVAFVLHCALDDRKGARVPVSREALSLYMNTCGALGIASEEPERMLSLSRRLAQAAPRYASAHAMHGIAASWAAFGASSPETEQKMMAEARQASETAIRLDPRAPKAYVAREMSWPNQDWAAREDDLVKSLSLAPDLPPPAIRYAKLLADVGRFRKAIELARRNSETKDPRGVEMDPREPTLLAADGDLPAARAALDRMDRIRPGYMDDIRWMVETWWGDPSKAPDLAASGNDWPAGEVACAKAFLPRLAAARGAVLKGLPEACGGANLGLRVRLTARQGDIDGAYALLATRDPRSRRTMEFLYYPELAAFRADPRFGPLAERLGLLAYWKLPGRTPDFCVASGPPPICATIKTAR